MSQRPSIHLPGALCASCTSLMAVGTNSQGYGGGCKRVTLPATPPLPLETRTPSTPHPSLREAIPLASEPGSLPHPPWGMCHCVGFAASRCWYLPTHRASPRPSGDARSTCDHCEVPTDISQPNTSLLPRHIPAAPAVFPTQRRRLNPPRCTAQDPGRRPPLFPHSRSPAHLVLKLKAVTSVDRPAPALDPSGKELETGHQQ